MPVFSVLNKNFIWCRTNFGPHWQKPFSKFVGGQHILVLQLCQIWIIIISWLKTDPHESMTITTSNSITISYTNISQPNVLVKAGHILILVQFSAEELLKGKQFTILMYNQWNNTAFKLSYLFLVSKNLFLNPKSNIQREKYQHNKYKAEKTRSFSSLLSPFWKNKRRLMRSPCCVSVCLCLCMPSNSWKPEQWSSVSTCISSHTVARQWRGW
jgi:hypothetical protein